MPASQRLPPTSSAASWAEEMRPRNTRNTRKNKISSLFFLCIPCIPWSCNSLLTHQGEADAAGFVRGRAEEDEAHLVRGLLAEEYRLGRIVGIVRVLGAVVVEGRHLQ